MTPEHDHPRASATAERRELLRYLVREGQRPEQRADRIEPRERHAPLPMSFQQQRQYILDQLDTDSSFSVLCTAIRMRGPLDTRCLRESLDEMAQRHEVLRSTFHEVDGQPELRIAPAIDVCLPVVDLTALTNREDTLAFLKTQQAKRRFDLSTGPLLRATLVRLAADEHVLVIAMHHIVSDGWSVGIVHRELCTCYEAKRAGRPSTLAGLPVQYVDYAFWQRDTFQGERLERDLKYWIDQLRDVDVLQLPTDHPRPPVESHQGRTCSLLVPSAVADGLRIVGRRGGATLFMVLLAAFQLFIARYVGQSTVAVGSPIANRTRRELEGLIGFFANILVLRATIAGNPTFTQFLRQVRDVVLDASQHQDCPFEKVVEALQPPRTLSHAPLFQVWFALEGSPNPPQLSGLLISLEDIERQTSRFDLGLTVTHRGADLELSFEHSVDLFDAPTIQRLAEHFLTMLSAIVLDPEQAVWHLPMVTPAQQLELVSPPDRSPASSLDTCLHERLETQARANPDAVAVACEDRQLTYAALMARAQKLARRLRVLGIRPECRVALCAHRSIDMIVGMVGIVQAGGAYVPLDSASPLERRSFMLADSAAPVLVGHSDLIEPLARPGVTLVSLDHTADWLGGDDGVVIPVASIAPSNLAYTIYTSGSTGNPKGVQVIHSAVVNLVDGIRTRLPFGKGDVWTMCHSIGFDLSVWEIWAPLLSGGTLVVVPATGAQDPEWMWQLVLREQVTILNQTPSGLRLIVDAVRPAAARGSVLRTIICGGEAFPKELAQELLEWHVPVWSFYGPTEATVWTSVHPIARGELHTPTVPIGRAIPGNSIYLIDRHHELAPVGARAELCIGGVGLARAYLNKPDQTADMFRPDPFSVEPGARLYKTGDLARYTSEGSIEFLGRRDHQIKLRGYRIELGEIESTLRRHPQVRDALALVQHERRTGPQLLGYVVADPATPPTPSELRAYAKALLPEYMVPAAVVVLDRWPLTRNGKVDRAALPPATPPRESDSGAPRTADELVIASLFSHVLGIEHVAVDDDFFELGGHSLLAPQLMSRLRELFHVALPTRTLFEAPTVAELARRVTQAGRVESTPTSVTPLVAALQIGSERAFFCVHPGGGGVSCYRDLARRLGRQRTFYGLQAPELDQSEDRPGPHTSVEDIAAEYVAAMRHVQPSGPYLLGGWSAGGLIAFDMARQLHRAGADVALLALIDCEARFEPAASPDEDALAFLFAKHLANAAGKELALSFERFCELGPDEQFGALLDALKMDNLLPRETRLSWFSRVLDGVRARARHVARYVPSVYAGEITLFRASDRDAEVAKAQNALDSSPIDDPTRGWAALSHKPVIVCDVPGNHFNLVWEPHVQILGARLKDRIEAVERALVDERSYVLTLTGGEHHE